MIQAIETQYKGYRFRSRLEARWAVFFDALGVPWEYEKEGYELPSGRYLPDFWLPEDSCFYEIKGVAPDDHERLKAKELSEASGHRVVIASGSIGEHELLMFPTRQGGFRDSWLECRSCGHIGFKDIGRLACRHATCRPDSPRLLAAIDAAKTARFEFGQTPARSAQQCGFCGDPTGGSARVCPTHNDPWLRVYCAGKIAKNDWRHQLFPGIRSAELAYHYSWLELLGAPPSHCDVVGIEYAGPFFVSDDHGCFHGPETHGVVGGDCAGDYGRLNGKTHDATDEGMRECVVNSCRYWIKEADELFAWLDDPTAYGTIAEIGYAAGLGKRIDIFGPSANQDQWFAHHLATPSGEVTIAPDPLIAFQMYLERHR